MPAPLQTPVLASCRWCRCLIVVRPDRLGRVQRISDLLTLLIGTTDEFPGAPALTPPKNGKASKNGHTENGNASK